MEATKFIQLIRTATGGLFTGVPDSQLGPFCDALAAGGDFTHITAVNEGAAAALAAGHHLAGGGVPCVYMQNSGLGNAFGVITSLLSPEVYAIPVLFVVGFRGEPGVHDEPQHLFQGAVTLPTLELLRIDSFILDKNTSDEQLADALTRFAEGFSCGKSAAIVVKKGALTGPKAEYRGAGCALTRERAIEIVIDALDIPGAAFVCTTGKASRELFELRERRGEGHRRDFLTVGSMGHASSIALGLALGRPERTVTCIDGDGAALMHLGAMASIGREASRNLLHILLDNGAHETVGGMLTAAPGFPFCAVAKAAGYRSAASCRDEAELRAALAAAQESDGPHFVGVAVALGARDDLGRPTTSPQHNKRDLMEYLQS